MQLWRHDSSDWDRAAAAARSGRSEVGTIAEGGRGGGRAAEQQRRRQEGGGRGAVPQVPVLAETAAAAAEGPGEADLQGAQGGSEEQQRLLGGGEGGSSNLQRQQQQEQVHGQQLDAGMLEEGSEEWKPSKAGRMTWRERLQRTGKRAGCH